MKRTRWILVLILVALAGISTICYIYRQHKALDQYVHPDSHAIVSVSVDDLLLDNLDQLFKSRTPAMVEDNRPLLDVKNWWKAGIKIPAQIHFFSLREDPLTFFTIQRIDDSKKWTAFLKEHSTDTTRIMEGMNVLYDDQYVLFRITALKQDEESVMQTIWNEKNNWVCVRNFNLPPSQDLKAHVAYRHTDGTFQLFANISKGHIALSGDWHLTTDIPVNIQIRERETNDSFISLWSALPLTETPFIVRSLSALSDVEPDVWVKNTYDYVDLFVRPDMTTQEDTVITYDYDEDFNSIEKKEIQQTSVPIIENLWKGNTQLAAALPEKLFYRFYKHARDSLVLLSTKKNTELMPAFVTASTPFRLAIDFHHLPSSWNSTLRPLYERAFQIEVYTTIVNKNRLAISGDIRYEER